MFAHIGKKSYLCIKKRTKYKPKNREHMKQRAECTFCIPQMANIYPDRRKYPICQDEHNTYIEVDTETEYAYIESINHHMKMAYKYLQGLENYIETEKS
jgi:hypothetical protein